MKSRYISHISDPSYQRLSISKTLRDGRVAMRDECISGWPDCSAKSSNTHTHWQAASRASCTFIKQHPESLVSFCSSLSFLFTLYLLESTLKPCCHSFLCHSSFDTTHSLGKNGIKEYEMKIMLLFALWLFLLWLELVWFFMFLKYISSAYEDCIIWSKIQ